MTSEKVQPNRVNYRNGNVESKGLPLQYMLVCRVLLGNPYICMTPSKPFTRPPCMVDGCYSDACNHLEQPFIGCFDSVIHVVNHENLQQYAYSDYGSLKSRRNELVVNNHHAPQTTREFIVYDADQIYPDFLVEYSNN